MSNFLSSNITASNVTFSNILNFNVSKHQVVPASSGDLVFLYDANSFPINDVIIYSFIPANTCNTLRVPTEPSTLCDDYPIDVNGVVGDSTTPFDATVDHILISAWEHGHGYSTLRALPTAATPSIISLTVADTNANHLVAIFDQPVWDIDATGISLAFTNGTSRTITGAPTGNGTTTLTYPLSGSF